MKITRNSAISWHHVVIHALMASVVLCAAVSYAGDVDSIKVRGKIVRVNDTADEVFEILTKSDMVDQKVQKDPNNPNSLLIVKNYNVDGNRFTLYFARVQDPGPYRVIRIRAD